MRIPLTLLSFLAASLGLAAAEGISILPGKVYVAESSGECTVYAEGRAVKPTQTNVFPAPGLIIETRKNAQNAFVFSNGTGMFVGPETYVHVSRFNQERFTPNRSNLSTEPSISASETRVRNGLVGICTSNLLSGTVMHYSTAHGLARIHQKAQMAILAEDEKSVFYLLAGSCAISPTAKGAHIPPTVVLQPGEMVTLTRGGELGPVERIPAERLRELDDKVTVACRARMSVMFDEAAGADAPEIKAYPMVPAQLPINVVISPDRIY